MPRLKDYQKLRVYAWDRDIAKEFHSRGGVPLRTPEMQRFVDGVVRDWSKCRKLSAIEVTYNASMKEDRGLAHGTYKIEVGYYGRDYQLLCHELAHCLVLGAMPSSYDRRGWKAFADHGKIFVGVYMRLMQDYLKYDFRKMMELADQEDYCLDYIHPRSCGPLALNELHKIRLNRWMRLL